MINKLLTKILLVIYAIFNIAIIFYHFKTKFEQLSSSKHILIYFLIIGILVLLGIIYKYFIYKKNKILKYLDNIIKIVSIVFIVLGFILRITLIFININELSGDYATFYANASSFSNTNTFSSLNYVTVFPYLIPYIIVLGSIFKILGEKYIAVIILNICLDIASAILLYFTFSKVYSKKIGLFLTGIWIINPINIMWCEIVFPMSIVNFFLISSICLFEITEMYKNNKHFYVILTILLGILVGIANQFRPIFIVFIIALTIYKIYELSIKKNINKLFNILIIIILIISYAISNKLSFNILQSIAGQELAKSSGWTLYVGANVESKGQWNIYDGEEFLNIMDEKPFSAQKVQLTFQEKAIERYKVNGLKNTIKLYFNKFSVLTSDMASYTVNLFFNMQQNININILNIFDIIANIFVTSIIFLNLLLIFRKNIEYEKIMYILLSIGLITSHLLVEVSPRYALHVLVPMLISIVFFSVRDKNTINTNI